MQELLNLSDARLILAKAYMDTIGLGMIHERVWHAIEYIDTQIKPITEEMQEEVA